MLTVKPRSHFWMALLEGKKRWLLFPKEQAPLLHPVWPEGCHDPVFEADVETPDAVRTPAALLARGYEGILEAGATCSTQRLSEISDCFVDFFPRTTFCPFVPSLGENSFGLHIETIRFSGRVALFCFHNKLSGFNSTYVLFCPDL